MSMELIDWSEDSFGDTNPIDIELNADGGGELSFDEYSNLFGRKARARRQRRRLERIRNRQERRRLRRQGRLEAMRDRQALRTERKKIRQERKAIGEEEEPIEEAPSEESSMEEAPTPSDDSGYSSEPDSYVDEETGESDEEAGYTGDYGFDGVRQPSQIDLSYDDYFSADGGKMIDPKVQMLAQRIEKVKTKINDKTTMLKRIQNKLADPVFPKKNPKRYEQLQKFAQTLPVSIAKLQELLIKLEKGLASRSKFDGDFSDADGSTVSDIAKNKAEVRMAKLLARKERKRALRGRRKARVLELMAQYRSQGMSGKEALVKARQMVDIELPMLSGKALDVADQVTPVSTALDPSISTDRIVVPPQTSSADGTGLIGWDDMDAYDAPDVRNVELDFSNADGSAKKKTWMWVGIGVGVAVLGIVAYRMLRKK